MLQFFRTFLRVIRPEQRYMWLGVITHVLKNSPVWLSPWVTAEIINALTQPQPKMSDVWPYAIILICAFIQNVPMEMLHIWSISRASRNVELRLRTQLSRSIIAAPLQNIQQWGFGALQNKMLRDVDAQVTYIRLLYGEAMIAIGNFTFSFIIVALNIPKFLLAFVICVPIATIITNVFRERISSLNAAFRTCAENISHQALEMFRMLPLIRAHGLSHSMEQRLRTSLHGMHRTSQRLDVQSAMFAAINWSLFNLTGIVCLLVASWAYITQAMPITLGDIVMITGYFVLLLNAALGFSNMAPQTYKACEALRSIFEILDIPAPKRGTSPIHNLTQITFDSVSFNYDTGTTAAVQNLSFTGRCGDTLAIVGPSGSGKSTILNLLLGLLSPQSGRILLDEQDITTVDLEQYRHLIAIVPQEPAFLDDTIYQNIVFGIETTQEAVIDAVKQAGLWTFIESLPQKLEHRLSNGGSNLSGGEKQRLAIARALIRKPKLLVLDEATSALDSINEAIVQQSFANAPHCLTVIVAHRLATVRHANQIIVLDQGQIVSKGTHAALLQGDSYYAQAVKAQKLTI